ncbi:MAG: hypothetical protein LBK53_01740, partial [Heliobacteriaceae bacterium]|nr:hypothetical protein [Heliobacteriaceae bacterium]
MVRHCNDNPLLFPLSCLLFTNFNHTSILPVFYTSNYPTPKFAKANFDPPSRESVNFLLLCHCEDECNEDEAIQSKPLNLLDCRVGL